MVEMTFPCPSPVVQQLVVGPCWLGECWGSSQLEHPCGKKQAAGSTETSSCIISQLWFVLGALLVLEHGVQPIGHGGRLVTEGDILS